MRLNEIMTRHVKTVDGQTDLEQARDLMRVHDVRHLVVMDEGRVVGVLSLGDLGGARVPTGLLAGTVRDRMAEDLVTATPRTTVREAANLMRGHRIGCLPVLDDGKLTGIITDTDLLELLGSGAEAPSPRKKRATLRIRKQKLHQSLARRP